MKVVQRFPHVRLAMENTENSMIGSQRREERVHSQSMIVFFAGHD